MTLESLTERRQKLGEEFQKAMDQRERLRAALDEAGTVVERIRGAIVLCDEFIAAHRDAPAPTLTPAPAPTPGNGLDVQPPALVPDVEGP